MLLDISAHPPTVPMRGGARSGARSTRTVWTNSSYNATSPGKLARPATVRTSCMTQPNGEFDTVAEVASDDDVPEVRLQEFANGERLHGPSYWKRDSKFACGDGMKWCCHLCPYVIHKPTAASISVAGTHHLQYAHGGQDLLGRVKRVPIKVMRLAKNTPALWRCPLCAWGIPATEEGRGCVAIYRRARREHRLAAHPKVSALEWQQLSFRRRSTPASGQRKRIENLNRAVSKRHGTLTSSAWDNFSFPVTWINKSKRRVFGVRKAWRCRKCHWYSCTAKRVQKHVCCKSHHLNGFKPGEVIRVSNVVPLRRCTGFMTRPSRL